MGYIQLNKVPVNKKVQIVELLSAGLARRRMMDLGIIQDSIIEVVRRSPLGDPTVYKIKDTNIALREEEASLIKVKIIEEGE